MRGMFSKSSDWETIYPVGSIYMSVNSTSPTTLFGGTWSQLKDQFLLCAGSTYSAGSTGGSTDTTLTTANMPAHTHTRGTMDITGKFVAGSDFNVSTNTSGYINGAFSASVLNGTDNNAGTGDYDAIRVITFKASDNWTGATSSVGSGTAFNNMPPYLAVYVWKRTA